MKRDFFRQISDSLLCCIISSNSPGKSSWRRWRYPNASFTGKGARRSKGAHRSYLARILYIINKKGGVELNA